ncbi:MAG: ABC transporter permease [Planctomycetota bacterium]
MDLRELLSSIWNSLLDRKARVLLNMLGAAIGTGAVVLLVALGTGARDSVLHEFTTLGSGLVVATPGRTETMGFSPAFAGNNMPISIEDAEAVTRAVPAVRHWTGTAGGSARVEAKPRGRHVMVAGLMHDWINIWNVQVVAGTWLPEGDPRTGPRVAVLGTKLARELFPGENPLGRFVRICGTRFRVIGVIYKGRALGLDLDDMAYIPLNRAMKLFDLKGLTSLETSGGTGGDSRAIKSDLVAALTQRHRGHQDFMIVAQDDMLDALSGVLSAITTGLVAIAAISLVVSGVGIANTMLVTVSERRSEVGLKLALGATRGIVLVEFLLEAVVIAGVGAFTGLAVAVLVAHPLGMAALGEPAPTPAWILLLASGVSVVLGVAAGIWPARQASLIPPADALRAE